MPGEADGVELPEAEARRLASELRARRLARATGGHERVLRDNWYVTAPGREIPLALYRRDADTPARPLLYFHGGGWAVGSIVTHDALCAHLAARTGMAVISVHYRRTPENPYPAQQADGQAVLDWLLRHAAILKLDFGPGWVIGGDSAGAHVALTLAYALRGLERAPRAQLLFYPALDPGLDTLSARLYADGPALTRASMRWYWRALLGGGMPEGALPLRWPDLSALPSTVLVTAEHDLLRDEGELLHQRLAAQGIDVRFRRAPGMLHGFARLLNASEAARRQVDDAADALLSLLR
nr:alpha/beta hydrolase [Cupriavidus sp. AU9028]